MTDFYLLAIRSNTNGDPVPGGGVGHVVLVCPTATGVVPINEFTDDGAYPHADCGPASLSTFLNYCKISNDVRMIEIYAQTTAKGTLDPGLIAAAQHYGIDAVFSPQNPPPGPIANPAGGRMIPQADFYEYLGATQGGCIILPVKSIPQPVPTPIHTEDDDVAFLATAGVRPKGETLDPNGQGAVYFCAGLEKRHIVGLEAAAIPQFEKVYGPIKDFSAEPFLLDHGFYEGPPIDNSYPTADGYSRPAGWTPPGPAQ